VLCCTLLILWSLCAFFCLTFSLFFVDPCLCVFLWITLVLRLWITLSDRWRNGGATVAQRWRNGGDILSFKDSIRIVSIGT
jgi:hypothetical protein